MASRVLYLSYEEAAPEHTMKLDVTAATVTVQSALARFALEYSSTTSGSLQAPALQLSKDDGSALAADALLPCGLPNGTDLFVISTQKPLSTTVFAKEGSAIAASQAKAGDHSYYYSVGKNRGLPTTATANASLPPPVQVAKVAARVPEATISSYSILDDDGKVKVHIPMAGATALAAGAITATFRDRSFDLRVTTEKHLLRLHVPILLEEIRQEECFVKARSGKLVLTLVKRDLSKNWYELRKTKGVGDTEFHKIVPDAGEAHIFTL
eukprot:CAMPEP_0183357208 /NCGR_PEP_ID=MMETSP0164_2-20130417/45610_1 /TAXON_ID=221442 /ORGANISM="Coccolithus pelagicus ssp braarudi, Strain PLY182g" /LENGTH=267 /DNA_ID=CAMNT_0025530781 /DNA_START=10 /DNA_END=813 /DNA_ORIENTATION=-